MQELENEARSREPKWKRLEEGGERRETGRRGMGDWVEGAAWVGGPVAGRAVAVFEAWWLLYGWL
jgi:hypothetical protein